MSDTYIYSQRDRDQDYPPSRKEWQARAEAAEKALRSIRTLAARDLTGRVVGEVERYFQLADDALKGGK